MLPKHLPRSLATPTWALPWAVLVLLLAACTAPPAGAPTAVVTPSVNPADARSVSSTTPDAAAAEASFVWATLGEPESLDPAWTYESQGVAVTYNVYDGLVDFKRESPTEFVPALATAWKVSEDGKTYTFDVREGVQFHAGGTLEPHDVAYSLQRAMLQDRAGGPVWMLLQPALGSSSIEGYAVARASMPVKPDGSPPTLADVPPAALQDACAAVQAAVSADDAAGTVTVQLATPTPWFLQLMAGQLGKVLDQEWQVEQGDWDGTCEKWAQWHNPAAEKSVSFDKANGTGPYRLAKWDKGEALSFEAFNDYWRTEPAWEGGPFGPPRIGFWRLQKVSEFATRLAKAQTGEADAIDVPLTNVDLALPLVHTEYTGHDESAPSTVLNPDGVLKLFRGYPTTSAGAVQFNQAVTLEGGNEFAGSGKLDGEGLPPDFFADIHVRRGFNHCFDWETYIRDVLQGEGVRTRGPIIQGLQGYAADSPVYEFDLAKCKAELDQAHGGRLREVGFKLAVPYVEGGLESKQLIEILAGNLAQVNPKYRIDTLKLEWPSLLDAIGQGRVPLSNVGWYEDYHDASNWAQAFLHSTGFNGSHQNLPAELQQQLDGLVEQGAVEIDPDKRDAIYAELQQLAYDHALGIYVSQDFGRAYINMAVTGRFFNPLVTGYRVYTLTKGAD